MEIGMSIVGDVGPQRKADLAERARSFDEMLKQAASQSPSSRRRKIDALANSQWRQMIACARELRKKRRSIQLESRRLEFFLDEPDKAEQSLEVMARALLTDALSEVPRVERRPV